MNLPSEILGAANPESLSPADRSLLVERVRAYAAYTDTPPLSSRSPVHYHWLPGSWRSAVGKLIGRYKRRSMDRWAKFPTFPLDLSSDRLADRLGVPTNQFTGKTPVLLTHDIDSREGLNQLFEIFAPLEKSLGVRSTSFVVPKAYPLDHKALEGALFEIGVHGYDHGNRTPYLAADAIESRLREGKAILARHGAAGYRAPSLCRTELLLRHLGRHFAYDSSIPTSGGLFPTPNNGSATCRPYRLFGLWEIPLSLPRDGTLIFLGYGPEEILDLWIECAAAIREARGVVVLLTHCERRFSGSPRMVEAYRRFIEHLRQSGDYEFLSGSELVARLEGA